jgi:hexosaminidase
LNTRRLAYAFLLALISLAVLPSRAEETPLKLIPYPSSIQLSPGYLPLDKDFHATASRSDDPRLNSALTRALTRLDRECGGILRVQNQPLSGAATLTLEVAAPGEAIQSLNEDETYKLDVSASGAKLTAATDVGAMRGLETLLQLVTLHDATCALPYVAIDDAPRFRWRGYMLDVSRHFEPIAEIKRTLNGMEVAKLNVFHWHLSDDEGFRAESKKYPKLTANASRGEFYTQAELREIVAYARDRGIRVIPEFDMPGHSTSTVFAYPELGSGEEIKVVPNYSGAPHGELDPSNEKVYKFIDEFTGEMADIFPDAYYHIGGDEVEGKAWLANPRIAAFMQKKGFAKPEHLQAYFNQRLLAILTKHHKKMVGWDEILNPSLPKDIMVQSWRGEASLSEGAQQGYTGILSAPYYLDGQKQSQEMYLADPIPSDTKLSSDQQKLIFGGEVCMWAEQIHDETVDSRVWPRTLAIAERFWSPQSRRDVPDMYRRLRLASLELEDVGLTHIIGPKTLRRNLIASTESETIDTFAATLEPVSFGERSDTQHTDALQSLDRMVDAVVADPPLRQQMAADVNTVLTASSTEARALAAASLRHRFLQWQQISPAMQALAIESPRLNDIGLRAEQLGELATIGLESLAYLQAHVTPSPEWKQSKLAIITEAEKPSALIRFVFLPSLKQLAEATAGK